MRNLIEFLIKYNHWLLFAILETVCMLLLFQFNSYQGSVYFTSANTVAGKVYEWEAEALKFFHISEINNQLTQRNLLLEQQVKALSAQLSAVRDSNYAERTCAEVVRNYRLIPAKVVSSSLDKKDNLMTIDKGSADGIHPDMGVVCGKGVVGIVYQSSRHYSIVIPVLNSKSNISVMIAKRGYFGYLRWTGGASDKAYVDDVPRHARFALGDKIVTSGYSAIFPSGIEVGKVLHVYNSSDGLSYRIQVQLSTDFGNLRDVCVVDDTLMREQSELMKAAQDSVKLR